MLGRPQVIFVYISPSCIYYPSAHSALRAVKIKSGNSAVSQCHGHRTEQV